MLDADSTSLNGKRCKLPPLGFPRGEAGFLSIGSSEPIDKKTDEGGRRFDMGTGTLNNDSCPTRIVGADRIRPLAKRIGTGWLNGICSGFYHPSGKSDGFGGRRPSSVNIVGSEEPPILPASPRGKPRGANQSRLPFIQLLAKIRGYGRMLSAPTERV